MNINTRDLSFVNFTNDYGETYEDLAFINFNGVTVYEAWKELTANGVPPITLQKCKQANLIDYKLYGNTEQNFENLFDGKFVLGSFVGTSGLTFEEQIEESTTKIRVVNPIVIKPNTFYTVKAPSTKVMSLRLYDENGLCTKASSHAMTNGQFVFDSENNYSMAFSITSETNVNADFKVYEANTPEKPIEVKSVGDKTKNLFNPTYNFTSSTSGTLTIEYLKDEDCFVINGTAPSTTSYAIRNIDLPVIKGSAFSINRKYISGNITKINSSDYSVAYFGATDSLDTFNNWMSIGLSTSDAIKENVVCNYDFVNRFWFYISKGVVFENYKFKIQLEEGSVATDYEPYGYKIPVKVNGKNLLDMNNRVIRAVYTVPTTVVDFSTPFIFPDFAPSGYNLNRIKDVEIQNGVVTWDNQAGWYGIGISFKPEQGETYKVSYENNYGNTLSTGIAYYSNGLFTRLESKSTITLEEGETDVIIGIRSGQVETSSISNIQVEKGSIATNYEPCVDVLKVSKKNLFNEYNLIKYNTSKEYYSVTDKGITLMASHGAAWDTMSPIFTLEAGIYTISSTVDNVAKVQIGYPDGGTQQLSLPSSFTLYEKTDLKIKALPKTSGVEYPLFVGHIQIEKGDTATDYEPYGYKMPFTTNIYLNEPLRKIGDYIDYIDFELGEVNRNTKEVTFNGTENWLLQSTNSYGIANFYINTLGSFMENKKFICDKFPTQTSAISTAKTEGVYYANATAFYVRVFSERASSTTEFKNWLKDNNIKIYYSADHYNEPIELSNIPTIKGTTIIEVNTNILPSNMEVKYIGKE